MKKKEDTHIIKCPRCHASNLVTQSKCGKCGFIFPYSKAKNENFDPSLAAGESGAENIGGEEGANNENIDNISEVDEGDNLVGDGTGGEETIEEPSVPKHLIDRGQSEGLISSRGEWRQCPRCGADLKPDMKRCIKCGAKIK